MQNASSKACPHRKRALKYCLQFYFICAKRESLSTVKSKQKDERAAARRYVANIEILYRTEVFLAVLSLSLAVIYFVGTMQSFMDSTLVMILNLLSITSLACAFLSVVVIARELPAIFSRRRKTRVLVILSSIIMMIFSLILLFFSHTLIAVAGGF